MTLLDLDGREVRLRSYLGRKLHLVDPRQGPTEEYDSDWLRGVRRIGADRYYERPQL